MVTKSLAVTPRLSYEVSRKAREKPRGSSPRAAGSPAAGLGADGWQVAPTEHTTVPVPPFRGTRCWC